jgi:hypothetical protein
MPPARRKTISVLIRPATFRRSDRGTVVQPMMVPYVPPARRVGDALDRGGPLPPPPPTRPSATRSNHPALPQKHDGRFNAMRQGLTYATG